ncbi:Villin-3 [Zostera marina]|uniref:Villin-3 n=1 Tax=Zostera marina TaxID=29655 RepID=A0A0K9NGP9_ZOSMR|nr:Villin-3 [Zostera marina]
MLFSLTVSSGIEIWRIENLHPVSIPKESHGKFFMGDSYIILRTTALKSGTLCRDIHYWVGKDTSQNEADVAAIKTLELDAALGHSVQYREVQGHETEKFLSYFKPCIIPQEGGFASGFEQNKVNECEYVNHLYSCRGKLVVYVKEVPFARSSLNHDEIFILDTKSKIFQFNGSNTTIRERSKALDVVQYLKNTCHDGKCDIAVVVDGKMMADAETGEFWSFVGGFAPLQRKSFLMHNSSSDTFPVKLFCFKKDQLVAIEANTLTKELLDTNNCYVLDCVIDIFVWMGKSTSLEVRKVASAMAEDLLCREPKRSSASIIRMIEGYETVAFRSKFCAWKQTIGMATPEDGRTKSKIAALLKLQGLNIKGLQSSHSKEEPQPYIDCTGNLQVWRINGRRENILIPSSDQFKFYSGDCYILQYNYPGEQSEEVFIGTWFGKNSIEEEQTSTLSLASKMAESLKFQATQARFYEGKEPIQFFVIFQRFIVFKGGISSGYKNYIIENNIVDETYSEDGVALFRIQGSSAENMQAIQVDPVASSLNSSYFYILHNGNTVYIWIGSFATTEDQELAERLLDVIKPNVQSKTQKEGNESDQFWNLLGGKSEHASQRISSIVESDPHLFFCTFSKGNLKVTEIFNFTQDDLMTEDVFILHCYSCIFVWIGHEVNDKSRMQALNIGEIFLEKDILLENISPETPIFVITEGNEPSFFTRFFTWNSAKSTMHGNSFERKLDIIKYGVTPTLDKPKRRVPASYGGRSVASIEKSFHTRSMSFNSERTRVRGRSPAFNALAANFENPNRNLSTPPPPLVGKKLFPRFLTPNSTKITSPRSDMISTFTSTLETPTENFTLSSNANESQPGVQEDATDDDEGFPIIPYERLKTDSANPISEIDSSKRESYLSSVEFKGVFGMNKRSFMKLPKWKQNRLKKALNLF